MAERPISLRLIVSLLIVILVGAAGAGYLVYHEAHLAPPPGPRTVAIGDNVTVNYLGYFGSGPETGRVFDTSILADAKNNLSYPKSLEYAFRTNLSEYTPLGVHVGPNAPSKGYSLHNVTFGSVVTGFWRGLVGLPGNVSRSITIPPNLAYGPTNTSCLVTEPLVDHVPVSTVIESARFSTLYPNATKSAGTEFVDPTYHWTDLVLSVNATSVVVESLPYVGFTGKTNGWTATVTNISGGVITVTNDLAPAQAGLVLGHSSAKVCSTGTFIVSAVDATAGTFTENYNREVVGQTLVFVVTVVDIYA